MEWKNKVADSKKINKWTRQEGKEKEEQEKKIKYAHKMKKSYREKL